MPRPDLSSLPRPSVGGAVPPRGTSDPAPRRSTRAPIAGGTATVPRPWYRTYSWLKEAACLTADPDLFFPPDGERGAARDSRDLQALTVCAGCPVLEQCRRHALSARETYGIWGGTTEDERRSLHIRDRRARAIADRRVRVLDEV